MSNKKELYKQAVDAGLAPPDYNDVTLKELEAMLSDGNPPSDDTLSENDGLRVTNLRGNPVYIRGIEIEPNGFTFLSEEEVDDDLLMAKISHGVKTGVYSID